MNLFAILLLAPSLAQAGAEPVDALAAAQDPLGPLSGVPIEFRCDGAPPTDHAVYRRYPGNDLHALVRTDEEIELPADLRPRDPVDIAILEPWLDQNLCALIWAELAAAGAHAAPEDVNLPARALLDVRLQEMHLEGSREVEQRVGSTVLPISVPHWAMSMAWSAQFSIEYSGNHDLVNSAPLDLTPRGGAEEDDYMPLRLGALLRAATMSAFDGLPELLADEGRLGDLLFAVVDRPSEAPDALGVSGTLSDSFWLLLSPTARVRHDAMAFYLSSKLVDAEARTEMARWFLLHDSDLGLRRDALAWLMSLEAAPERGLALTDGAAELLLWLVSREPSPRVRSEVVHALAGRQGPDVRDLLLTASTDDDPRVAGVAIEALSRFPPATAAELEALELLPRPPKLAPWTIAFDGRLPPPPGSPDEHLLGLAAAAGGPAAEAFSLKWLRSVTIADADLEWVPDTWLRLSASPSVRIREEAIGRLSREEGRGRADEILAARVATETRWALRLLAIEGLFEPATAAGADEALVQASHADSSRVRAAAALRLAEVTGEFTHRRLEVLVRSDPDSKVRRAARKALRIRQALGT